MKRSVTMCAVLALCAVASSIDGANAADGSHTKAAPAWLGKPVRTVNGLVSGAPAKIDGVVAFKGIPFGAAPVGELRWKPPQPVASWQGVRPGDKFGSVCVQPHQRDRVPNNRSVDEPDSPPMSEDCLYLNVWTAAPSTRAKQPVMVWIYGGAYTEGAGSTPHNQGDPLAAKGVVVVTFNYRLGAFGFLAHPELTAESPQHASGNYALTDTLAVLRWVKQNIAAFGGNPDNVTIFGESAGSAISAALVGSPAAAGLFHKAIAESGTWMGLNLAPMRSRESAEQQTVKAATELGAADLQALRALPADQVAAKLPKQGMIVDGWVVPEDLTVTFAKGRQNRVDVIAGSNRDEGSFAAGLGPPMTAKRWQATAVQRWGNLAEMGLAAYPVANDAEANAANTQIFADNMAFLMRLFGERQRAIGKRAYVYHFVQEPPYAPGSRNLGVCHTCEMAYVFDNLASVRVYPDSSSPELAAASATDRKVAQITSSYWVNFAKKGDPNGPGLPKWPQIRDVSTGPVLHIGSATAVGDSLGPAKAKLYQGMYERQLAAGASSVQTANADCTRDRECLASVLTAYLNALVKHDATALPVTRNVKYTENGVRITMGDGLWQTASAMPTYRLDLIDEEAGQVGLLGRISENGNNNWFAARLQVEPDRKVSQIETLINRSISAGGGAPAAGARPAPTEPLPLMAQVLPDDERLSRAELVRISNTYFTGLDTDESGKNVPFSPECQRRENGTLLANNPEAPKGSMQWLDCKSQFDTGFSVIVTDIRERRFEVVDRTKGLAFGWGYFDHNGTPEKFSRTLDHQLVDVMPMFRQPFSFYIAEVFKVMDGQIRQIEAVLTPVPYQMESGW